VFYEAHVPKGGPDGGDGGRGADVVLVADPSLRDLQSYKRKAHYKGQRAAHGEGSNRQGASPAELVLRVPPGTVVTDVESGDTWDLVAAGQRATVARGGSGGRGNARFKSSTRQAPRFAERGLAGEEGWLDLRLKLLADVGLVGLPNAGKSSLLSRLTRADPKTTPSRRCRPCSGRSRPATASS
jgi:GTP-binding protein